MDKLTLGNRHQKGEKWENGKVKIHDRKYIDFIINGQSFEDLLGELCTGIGAFGWTVNKEYENKMINEFIGLEKPELETGRTSFYVCGECGDIGCGAVTAKIEITDKTVLWKDFGYENNYEEPHLGRYKEIGPFEFDRTEYFKTFEELKRKTNEHTTT